MYGRPRAGKGSGDGGGGRTGKDEWLGAVSVSLCLREVANGSSHKRVEITYCLLKSRWLFFLLRFYILGLCNIYGNEHSESQDQTF